MYRYVVKTYESYFVWVDDSQFCKLCTTLFYDNRQQTNNCIITFEIKISYTVNYSFIIIIIDYVELSNHQDDIHDDSQLWLRYTSVL